MKILYSQSPRNNADNKMNSPLEGYGIRNCYFKSIKQTAGDGGSTKKRHSHTGYEIHMIIEGGQSYICDSTAFTVTPGNLLVIPNGISHSLTATQCPTVKYAFTFSLDKFAEDIFDGLDGQKCRILPIPVRVLENISVISSLSSQGRQSDAQIIENCVFECVILLLHAMGITERTGDDGEAGPTKCKDERVELARQFIADNIEEPMQVSEVAAYCYISEKQLTRLFYAYEDISPANYIRREKIKHIEELLRETDLSIGEISDRMGCLTEQGFSAFFKKYNGMPPGEYRKMITSDKG